jgi:hypothetical protein
MSRVEWFERTAGVVHGLAQIGGRSGLLKLGPQRVHELLSVQTMRRLEREKLDHGCGLVAVPDIIARGPPTDTDSEGAEQLDSKLGHARLAFRCR